jgi:hypothetical protein
MFLDRPETFLHMLSVNRDPQHFVRQFTGKVRPLNIVFCLALVL